MSAAYFNQYLANQVNTASPEELVIMLYNGAIRFLTEAEWRWRKAGSLAGVVDRQEHQYHQRAGRHP